VSRSAVRRRQPSWADTLVVVIRFGLPVIRLRDVKSSLVVTRQPSGAKSLVRRQAVSLLVVGCRRQPTRCRLDTVRLPTGTVVNRLPVPACSRGQSSPIVVRLLSGAVVSGQFSRFESWRVAFQDESICLVARPSCSPWRENIFPL